MEKVYDVQKCKGSYLYIYEVNTTRTTLCSCVEVRYITIGLTVLTLDRSEM